MKQKKIQISVHAITGLEDEALGRLVQDEFDFMYQLPKEIGAWFKKLDEEDVEAFFAISESKPAKFPKASKPAGAKKKPASPKQSAAPKRNLKTWGAPPKAKATRARTSKPKPAAAAALSSRGADEEEPAGGVTTNWEPPEKRDKVLAYLKGRANATAAEIRTFCNLTEGQTKGLLKRLHHGGLIRVDGKARSARYSLATSSLNGAAVHP